MFAIGTIAGYYAWRNKDRGSCFIQALCEEFEKNGTRDDLLHLLTGVSRRVCFLCSIRDEWITVIGNLSTGRLYVPVKCSK